MPELQDLGARIGELVDVALGLQRAAIRLWEGLDEGTHKVRKHARDKPVETLRIELREPEEPDRERDTVVLLAGGQGVFERAGAPRLSVAEVKDVREKRGIERA